MIQQLLRKRLALKELPWKDIFLFDHFVATFG